MLTRSWTERFPDTKELLWFQNLQDLHALTREWVAELKSGTLSELVLKSVPPAFSREADDWIFDLEKWENPETPLRDLVNDLSVTDYLASLERAIKQAQAWVLATGVQGNAEERKITLSRLEQASWRMGRSVGERRWLKHAGKLNWADLKVVFLTTLESALHPNQGLEAYLFHRLTENSISLELLDCAHTHGEYRHPLFPFSSELCALHSHFLKGFLYSLSPTIQLEHIMADKYSSSARCRQTWTKR